MELLRSKSSARRFKLGDLIHLLLNMALPAMVFLLASQWQLYSLALVLVLLSKWRIFAVQPRFWWANVQANLIDVIVGVSVIGLMYQADGAIVIQALWALVYAVWLVVIKPRSTTTSIGVQATIGQALGITALYFFSDRTNDLVIIAGTWLIAYSAARHLVSSYEEDLISLLSAVWALSVTELAWLLNRWIVVYDIAHHFFVPQLTVIVLILGYTVANLYHDAKHGKLTARKIQYVFGLCGLLLFFVLTIFSNWSGSI
jgi:hypothetical protein